MVKKIPIGNKNSYRNSYRIGKWWKKFIAYTTMAKHVLTKGQQVSGVISCWDFIIQSRDKNMRFFP